MIIRKADIRDVKNIQKLIAFYAKQDLMLARSLLDIYENIRDYYVYSRGGSVLGCCALHICWDNLAEVKALAVDERYNSKGIGSRLVKAAIKEAKKFKISKLFTLTYVPGFFAQFGFKKINRNKLPHKIWTECLKCAKFPNCDEQAMMLKI
ncbi:MAG: N-acetyltransferase [Candidatus Omnitrophota bacterium]